jgi:signal transduction histidine kinase
MPVAAALADARGAAAIAALSRVIVIDDDDVMLLACRRTLEKEGYEVETFSSPRAGIERLAGPGPRPQLALVDLKMPELDGLQVIQRIRAIDPQIVIAVISGYATIATVVEAMSTGAHDFLPKPFTPDELRLVVRRAAERWRLIQEADRHRREREAAERRIVTFVSHQLKSPVAAVTQYLDVLLFTSRATLPPTTLEWLERAQARLHEMATMLDDWLALSRLERGVLCESGVSTGLDSVAREVVAAATAQADGAGVAMTIDVGDAPTPVCSDRPALVMLVSNLVGNAIKYNRRGGSVSIRVARDGDTARLEVADTGIGIAPDSLPHVFEEFYRAIEAKQQGIPGSGLGLAICGRIAAELGGGISVDSAPGAGTTFVVRLPLAREGRA